LSKDDYLRNKANLELFIKRQTIAAIRDADGDAAHFTSDTYHSDSPNDATASVISDSDDAPVAAITQSSPSDSFSDSDLAGNVDSGALAFHHFCACVENECDGLRDDGSVTSDDFVGNAPPSLNDAGLTKDKATLLWPIHGCRSSALSAFFPSTIHATQPPVPTLCTRAHSVDAGFPSVKNVPAPSLLIDGDVEANPGPRRFGNVYGRPPTKSLSIGHLAFILFTAAPPLPTAASV
jgi:hypothetical protein